MDELRIRDAAASDAPLLVDLLHRAARFQGDEYNVIVRPAQLAATMFGERPFAYALLAEIPIGDDLMTTVGVATYYFTFSTYRGRPRLYLEDLYVEEDQRGHGVGTALMWHLARIALASDCYCMEWQTPCAPTNAALPFYWRAGAEAIDTVESGTVYHMHLSEDALRRLAQSEGHLHRSPPPL